MLPGRPRRRVAQQVGQRDRQVRPEDLAAHRAHPRAQGHHAQRAARHRRWPGTDRREPAQLGFQDPGPLEDHAFGGTPAEQRGQPVRLAGRDQPGGHVVARVPGLGQRPQAGGHGGDGGLTLRILGEHVDDPLQDGGVQGQVARRSLLVGHAGHLGQQVGEGVPAEARADVEPGQVVGQHPDQRAGARGAREADQVLGDRPLGQVEHRDLAARGQPVRAGRGERRGPAGERAAGQVHPVHPGRRAGRVPAFLMLVGDAQRLPFPHLAGVLGLPGVQAALLGGPSPAHPRLLVGQPRPERPLTLPQGVPANPGDQRAADHPEPGHQGVEHAGRAEREHQQAERDGDTAGRLQRPVDPALLMTLGRRPVGVEPFGLRRGRPPRRRPRIRGRSDILPAQARPQARGDVTRSPTPGGARRPDRRRPGGPGTVPAGHAARRGPGA